MVDPDKYPTLAAIVLASPEMKTLKKNKVKLSDEERDQAMKAGAVWHHGPNGEETCGIQKSTVKGKDWYWCATHRAYQCKPTLKGAIKAFEFIKTTSAVTAAGGHERNTCPVCGKVTTCRCPDFVHAQQGIDMTSNVCQDCREKHPVVGSLWDH
jgi:hypothetical protein